MIIRTWNGWTTAENAAAYEELLNSTIAPNIIARNIPGLSELTVLRRLPTEATAHFQTLMTFDNWASVERFAGPTPAGSVVPEPARRLLARHDEQSQHFELLRTHRP